MTLPNIEVSLERREALFTPYVDDMERHLKVGLEVNCMVLGLFQGTNEDGPCPLFVIELRTGHCTYAAPEQIRFLKEVK